jgi:alpha-tubulin suppressor-like RCC1 family protein
MATNYLINGAEFSDNFIPRDAFTTGGLWGWGVNRSGSLANNTLNTGQYDPTKTYDNGLNWKQVSIGEWVSSGIKTDGTLWTWGYNGYGQLGDGTNSSRPSPVQVAGTNWKQISCHGNTNSGSNFMAAIKSDGTLWTWGYNTNGQLGDNTRVDKSSPVQVLGTNWKLVDVQSSGSGFCAAIKTDGTLWTWGSNDYGELGDGTTSNRSSPVQTVSGGTNWKLVSCGGYKIMAIKTDGTMWGWGYGFLGQLGTGDGTNRSSPTQVVGQSNWKYVYSSIYLTQAIKTDGTLWGWGRNGAWQLGDGTTTSRSSPVQNIYGNNWKQVVGNDTYSLGIKTDGTLWGWGTNTYGNLGTGNTTDYSTPVQTSAAGSNWTMVAVSALTSFGLRDNF